MTTPALATRDHDGAVPLRDRIIAIPAFDVAPPARPATIAPRGKDDHGCRICAHRGEVDAMRGRSPLRRPAPEGRVHLRVIGS